MFRVLAAIAAITLSLSPSLAQTPSTLTFEPQAVTGRVAPGSSGAWMRMSWRRLPFGSASNEFENAVVADDDRDGSVRWALSREIPEVSLFFMVDQTTGEVHVGYPDGERPDPLPYPEAMFLRDPQGNFSHIVTTPGFHKFLWVRPGVGAWEVHMSSNSAWANLDPQSSKRLVTTTSLFRPLGPAEVPAGVQKGDVMVAAWTDGATFRDPKWYGGVVDAQMASGAGTLAGNGSWSFAESEKVAKVRVFRTGGSDGVVSVNYATEDESARAGLDYVASAGRVTFGSGEIAKEIDVELVDDALYHIGGRGFRILLSDPAGAPMAGDGVIDVSLYDDDPTPHIALGPDQRVREGNDGPQDVTIEMTLNGMARSPVTVQWFANGAVAGPTKGTVTFAPGEARKSFTLTYVANTTAEANRKISVWVLRPSSTELLRGEATITIVDDDGPPGPERTRAVRH